MIRKLAYPPGMVYDQRVLEPLKKIIFTALGVVLIIVGILGCFLPVVPGIAFDRQRYRLGRGAGYYDRFLEMLPRDIPSVGLAFDFQLVDCLPHHQHDIPVSHIIVNDSPSQKK